MSIYHNNTVTNCGGIKAIPLSVFPVPQAEWVWLSHSQINQYVRFEAEFSATACEGTLSISADSDYAAFIDGALIAFNQYDDHPFNKAYDAVSFPVSEGRHTLRIDVWYQGEGCYSYLPGPAGLIFALQDPSGNCLCSSKSGMRARPIRQYRMGPVEPLSGQLGNGFFYDASMEDGPWEQAVTVSERKNTTFYARPVEKLRLLSPVCATPVKEGFWQKTKGDTPAETVQYANLAATDGNRFVIYDLGREEAGLLTLSVKGKKGDSMIIAWGEHIERGHVEAYIEGRHFATVYTLHEGENRFTHYFRRLGGRYLQVMCQGDIRIDYVTVIPTEYPVACISKFRCPDPLLQQIYDVSVRTLHLCMHEHYEDTPWREQALYAMDSRNQALFGYCCFGESRFPAAYLDLFREGIRKDHMFEICAHAKEKFTIPSFSLSWMMAARDHYLWTGDQSTAEKMYPCMKEIADGFLERIDQSGICVMSLSPQYWNFYEWTDGMDDQNIFVEQDCESRPMTKDAALNLYLILALEALEEMAAWLATGEENLYREKRLKLKECVYSMFVDPEKKAVMTHPHCRHYTEFNQALALLAKLLPDEEGTQLRARLAQKNNGFVPISLSCSLMKYQALMMERKYDETILNDIRETWGKMLAQGATSFWELEDGASAYDWAGSLCHGWSAVPVYVLTAMLLGVTPIAPGFETWSFAPSSILQASGHIPTPNGDIIVTNGTLQAKP